jgi:hypothetical protein
MSTLDARKNFAISSLATGIAIDATSLDVASGEGAKFPAPATDGAFNVVIWDGTYNTPDEDANKEIVRVTARSTDTLTITRAQEGTSAGAHNTGGHTYKIMLSLTAKMVTDIETALDAKVATTGNETIAGVKTFSSIPVLPASDPTTDNQAVRKAYVDGDALSQKIGVGKLSNTLYENYQFLFGNAEGVWQSTGSPNYFKNILGTPSATGAFCYIYSIATGVNFVFSSMTKKMIIEFDATITANAKSSCMGFARGLSAAEVASIISSNREAITFITHTDGTWYIFTGNGTTHTKTAITTPSAGKHTFRIEYSPATPSATFYIDGVSVGTITTNLPATGNSPAICFINGTDGTVITAVGAPCLAIAK